MDKYLFLKSSFIFFYFWALQSCEINKNDFKIDSIVNDFENQYPLVAKESLPLNSYEVGFFTNHKDTIVYIQRNEMMFYSDVSKFLIGKEISNFEMNNSLNELYYYGSFYTVKKNIVNVYDMSSSIGNIFLNEKVIKKENLFRFSFRNLDQDASIEISEPKYIIYKIKKNEFIKIDGNVP